MNCEDKMYLITGLGNPTEKYEHTRHNAGFDTIDILSSMLSIKINRSLHKSHYGKGMIGSEKIILAKPRTYMNLSGQAVQSLMQFYKIDKDHLIVIYDDSDLEPGRIRIRKSGSAGGHNGMKDIIRMLGTQDFIRIRVGIGRPPEYMDMVDFVLGRPAGEEKEIMDAAFHKAAMASRDIIENGVDHAMNYYNGDN